MAGSIELTFGGKGGARREDDAPRRVLVLIPAAASGRRDGLLRLDIDSFEQIVSAQLPELQLSPGGASVAYRPTSLEALEPDLLARDLPPVRELLDLGHRLRRRDDPETALARLGTLLGADAAATSDSTAAHRAR